MGLFNALFGKMIDRRIAGYQNDIMDTHAAEVENMYRQMRGWRHDYVNQLQTMKIMLDSGDYESLGKYMDSLGNNLASVDAVIKTGNVTVDAILNSKLSLAKSNGINVNAKAKMPDEAYSVSDVELCAVIGNLLSNAIEAAVTTDAPEERFIRVYIGKVKKNLYISVTNSYGGKLDKTGNEYKSTKADTQNHGFGLMRIDSITEKYNGFINRKSESGVFATEVMFPLK